MTKDEVVNRLTSAKIHITSNPTQWDVDKWTEAFDVAIDAVKGDGDMISKQDVIDVIKQYYNEKKYIKRSQTILSAICIDIKNIIENL